jgi:hypothetical protein
VENFQWRRILGLNTVLELIYERGRKKKLKTVRKELNCNFEKSASGEYKNILKRALLTATAPGK